MLADSSSLITYHLSLITILGPTACGKTALAVRLARAIDGEIISADSRQVYIGMDLGTGKDLREYSEGGLPVPYHLIDILPRDADYSVFDFQRRFFEAFESIRGRGRWPILAGGTGLYLDSILRGYRMVKAPRNEALRAELAGLSMAELESRLRVLKPELHNTTDLETREHAARAIEIQEYVRDHPEADAPAPAVRSLTFGIRVERGELYANIRRRLRERIEAGMVEEARRLRDEGMAWERFAYFGLEYKYLAMHLRGEMTLAEMEEELAQNIRRFAKRQETWFRKIERHGVPIRWIGPGDDGAILAAMKSEGLL